MKDKWSRPEWAVLDVIDNVDWSETQEPHYEDSWLRPDEVPAKGALRAIRVSGAPPVTPSFWVVFQPALSLLNGWDEHPEELEHSALVEVRMEEKLEKNWFRVQVLQVVLFPDLADYFAPSVKGDVDDLFSDPHRYTVRAQSNNWHFVEANFQSDAGYWIVFSCDGVTFSIHLYGHFMIGDGHRAYAGNRFLSDEEHQHVLSLLTLT